MNIRLYCFIFAIKISILSVLFNSVNANDFNLIGRFPPTIIYDISEAKVVHTAVNLFRCDYHQVSNKMLNIANSDNSDLIRIYAGTRGKSTIIDELIKKHSINIRFIDNTWEGFTIQVINIQPTPILVVIGSDSRGTAFGIMELSRIIGVSPWAWWADTKIREVQKLSLPENYINNQKPSVAYRGIFLNDEDWGLMPWSTFNFEPTNVAGEMGPKSYSKIFELLLRLRANTLWPAMHSCTVPFFFVEGNREAAEKYGISIGSSHCEPMNRNILGEWKAPRSTYNYITDKDTVRNFWAERVQEVADMNTIFTLGMRGVHDSKMQGVNTVEEQKEVLSKVLYDQRHLIKQFVNDDITSVPQTFIPYKEVLDIYNLGLKVPEDVTLIWCDDNYGYITRLSNADEQKRSGGAGVYYHVSYWGRPHDYLWLASTPPALLHMQMKMAWDTNARKMWILNVGDIKPSEYLTEYFLDLAWNFERTSNIGYKNHMKGFYEREFEDLAAEITEIKDEYYRLAYIRKPEFMGWSRVEEGNEHRGITPVVDTDYNPFMFGDELNRRIQHYDKLECKLKEVVSRIPLHLKSAYFQLVEYPVLGASSLNKKLLYAQKSRLFAKYNLSVASEYKKMSLVAYEKIAHITKKYNESNNAKWNYMMDMKPRNLPVFDSPTFNEASEIIAQDSVVFWLENANYPAKPDEEFTLNLIKNSFDGFFVSVFKNTLKTDYFVEKSPDWLKFDKIIIIPGYEDRLVFKVDWNKLSNNQKSRLKISNGKNSVFVNLTTTITKDLPKVKTEGNGYVSLNWQDASNMRNAQLIDGIGYRTKVISLKENGTVEFNFNTIKDNQSAVITVATVPNHPTLGGDIRYAISLDGETEQIVSFKTVGRSEEWKLNVLSNQARTQTTYKNIKSGIHKLTLRALDPFIMIDQVMIDFESERKYYEIP